MGSGGNTRGRERVERGGGGAKATQARERSGKRGRKRKAESKSEEKKAQGKRNGDDDKEIAKWEKETEEMVQKERGKGGQGEVESRIREEGYVREKLEDMK